MKNTDINKVSGTVKASELYLQPSDSKVWEATEKATEEYGICPHRLWAPASGHPWQQKIVPYLMQFRPGEPVIGHENHERCQYDSCYFSNIDSTTVDQRHELKACIDDPCERLHGKFPLDILEETTRAGKIAAWTLDGMSIIEPARPFMAVSHVWSDGTGVGDFPQGEVNRCLYDYFKGIAERFECEGIWWDTICLPTNDDVRYMALNEMHTYYDAAEFTLVHDCYLRKWEWFDAETACIAIIMSPWFSRGWTALELTHSPRVKVVFKDGVIKDLDEDILANPQSIRHRVASELISSLRQKTIKTISDLLQIVHSRATSLDSDMAIICALLAGLQVTLGAVSHEVYQDTLMKIGKLSHGHLFHRSLTMPTPFSWCPYSLLDMEISATEPTLRVLKNGSIFGPWKVIHGLKKIPLTMYEWTDVHPMIQVKLRAALSDPENHRLLAEPEPPATDDSIFKLRRKPGSIPRALLVKKVGSNVFFYQGPVYFNPPLEVYNQTESCTYVTIGPAAVSEETADIDSEDYLNRYRVWERFRARLSPLVHKIGRTEQPREKVRKRQDSYFGVRPILGRLRSFGA